MCAKVTSIGLKGLEGYRLNVEVKTFVGNDGIRIVGLPDAAVKESKKRISAAMLSLECIQWANMNVFDNKMVTTICGDSHHSWTLSTSGGQLGCKKVTARLLWRVTFAS
ncbi:magnesium chelatase domain-containing protein [Neobacillus niacini]|uniref:magnesium chelatase domain-containing protein n=1 Tax=Neobacillus niacini TaxID=86668 RepID=UPI003B015CB1